MNKTKSNAGGADLFGNATATPRASLWQLFMLALCIYVLAALFVETGFKLSEQTAALLTMIDNIICVIFIGDFVYNIITAKSKLGYLKWGWIDLISSIPNVSFLRWGRMVRILRILRLLRGVRSARVLLHFIFLNRARGAFWSVAAVSVIIMILCSIAILNFETGPQANIKTAGDALWWTFATITTVGYGEVYPTTTAGRLIAAVLMTAGVGVFGTFTAYVASFFLQQEEEEDVKRDEIILAEIETLKMQMNRMEDLLRQRDSGPPSHTKNGPG